MGLLDKFADYGGNWEMVDKSKFSKAELKNIDSAEVVEKEQDWGISTSICLHMKSGKRKYIALSNQSDLEVGDVVDPSTIEVMTFERDGEDKPCFKADGEIADKD